MIEDKLTRDERIRLESLAQANATSLGRGWSEEGVLSAAKNYEKYIREGAD